MSIGPINSKMIGELNPGQTVWDTAIPGFGVRCQRRAIVYVFKYRDKGGRQRFFTIGRHGDAWTPERARKEAMHYRATLIGGSYDQDLRNHFSASAPTLERFSKIYLERYATLHKSPRSLAEDIRNLKAHILPALGAKRLHEISAADIRGFQLSRKDWAPNANRCLALLSHIFTIAAKWNAVPPGTNPCRGLRRFQERPRQRFLSQEELGRLGFVLASATDGSSVGPISGEGHEDWRVIGAIKLLIFTGARLDEILSLQWAWINWDVGIVQIPASKRGGRTVALPAPALQILFELSRKHGRVNKHVFPGRHRGFYFTNIQKPWQRIRERAGISDVRISDLRHCYAGVAIAGGESLYDVGAVLGLRAPTSTQRYAHLAGVPVLDSANRTAAKLATLMYAERHVGNSVKDKH